jgi:arylsulfatase A-like enzyme
MRRLSAIQFACLLFACFAVMGCTRRVQYNVLLITIDTLRADHLSCYGYKKPTSPAIDALAREGVLFTYAMAQRAETWPSITSILTSMYPQTHGVRINGDKLDPSKRTIAEMLKNEGFATSAFITNMQTARHAGFDTLYAAGKKISFLKPEMDIQATNAARKWLRKNKSVPFFAWIHYLAPHAPYIPPQHYRKQFSTRQRVEHAKLGMFAQRKLQLSQHVIDTAVNLYDAEIAYVDDQVKQILQELRDLKVEDRTLVILTADHGEELNDRNQYFGHACSVYDAALRIPLILRLPKVLPSNQKVDAVVESVDIAPTVFELLSLKKPASFEGKSLVNVIRGKGSSNIDFAAYSEIVDKVATIRTQKWRYISNPTGYSYPLPGEDPSRSGQYYLIDREAIHSLSEDPDEKINSIVKHADTAATLRQQLLSWRQKDKGYERKTLDKETEEELKALGYIQ